MAAGSLITLASGRLTPLSRMALTLGLGLFLALILLVQPVHRPGQPMVAARASVRALEQGSPWVERAALEEGASLFMPVAQASVASVDAAQPDASPFSGFGPEYRHDPNKPLALGSTVPPTQWKSLAEAFPLAEEHALATLGQKAERPLPRPRKLQIQVFSDINETVFQKDFFASDQFISISKYLTDKSLNISSAVEFRLGIDAMGVQARPYLSRSSGDSRWDLAASDWARNLPWAVWLKPGSYRVVIGP